MTRETRLQMAQRHVLAGRQIVQRQQDLIERKRDRGLDTDQSEDLLRAFRQSLATFEDDLTAIIGKVKL